MSYNFLSREKWYFTPTRSKSGKVRNNVDIKNVYHYDSGLLFNQPTIIASDLHQHTLDCINKLCNYVDLSKYIVLTVGDMAGTSISGSDGDPTDAYRILAEHSKEFYFVQGNHDLPAPDNSHLKLINQQGNQCNVPNGKIIKTGLGTIAGVNGIISDKRHPYKMSQDKYVKFLEKGLKGKRPDILMTHDTPAIVVDKKEYIGSDIIKDIVAMYKPKIHIFGHCHHPTIINEINGITYINTDSRILIFG